MDITTGIQDVNITVTPPPALTVTVPAVTNVTMPITGVGGLKGDTGATGPAGTTDHTLLTNIGTNTHAQIDSHIANVSNPHAVTKAQVGLSNVPNTDFTSAVASNTSAIAAKADKTYVDSQDTALQGQITTNTNNISTNTSNISANTTAISGKQATLVSGTNIKTINGSTLLGSGDLVIASGGTGTVTSVTSATTDATVATTTTTPVITIVSAPKLTTARTINGVAFDGTANITVADSTKEPTITIGTTSQYYRGDKTFQTLDKTAVGLASVDNTSDATKNSATATLTNKTLTTPTIGGATITDATDIAIGSTTGTKIATATTQKLGFFGAVPVVQQAASTDLGTALASLGLRASGTTYTLSTSGTASFSGNFKVSYTTRTANATLSTSSSYGTFADATTAGFTITLPTAVGNGNMAFKIIKIDSSVNTVTVATTSSQLINAATTYVLSAQYKLVEIVSNGTQWYIIGSN